MISFLVLALNLVDPASLKNQASFYLSSNPNIGGEITEIVSAPPAAGSELAKDNSFLQSTLGVPVADAGADPGIFEDSSFSPLITGEDSLLQNQNPITAPTVEPAPAAPRTELYYGPSLDGYFIFPTTGYNHGRPHPYNAVDISHGSDCLSENIPVFAAASGVVNETYPTESAARWANGGYGNNIVILHTNGVFTRYAHLKEILVSVGQYVNQGSVVAFMGGYPRMPGAGNSTGCHLHFEVHGAQNPFAR